MKSRISDVINIEQIETWKDKVITITAQTGAGKSYFIKNTLYDYAKTNGERILMLIHRLNCIEQFNIELEKDGKTDIIDIMTYQKNEQNSLPKDFNFDQYQYIVCDEFHYFLSDSYFNSKTDVSLERILDIENTTKIFLSATSKDMCKYIGEVAGIERIKYEFPYDYSFIENLTFFNRPETLNIYMERIISSGEKAIFFIQSATRGFELHQRFKEHTLFNCGKSDKHYSNVDRDKITNMLRNEHFDEQILITTTCLEAGVNIIDLNLKHIVLDVQDIDVMLQCIGRKRIQDEEDKINLYIKNINNNMLGGKITHLSNELTSVDYLLKNGEVKYVEKYGRIGAQSNLIYDSVNEGETISKAVNKVMYFKRISDLGLCYKLIKHKYGYCKYISDLLCKKYEVEEERQRAIKLKPLLEEIQGQRLYGKYSKEPLINAIDAWANGRKQTSYEKLNDVLRWLKLPYIILPKKSGNKRYWIVEKIDE